MKTTQHRKPVFAEIAKLRASGHPSDDLISQMEQSGNRDFFITLSEQIERLSHSGGISPCPPLLP